MKTKDEFLEMAAGLGLPRQEKDLRGELRGFIETFEVIQSNIETSPGPSLTDPSERLVAMSNLDEAKQFFVSFLATLDSKRDK